MEENIMGNKTNGYVKAVYNNRESILNSLTDEEIAAYEGAVNSTLPENSEKKERLRNIIIYAENEYIELKDKLNKNMEKSSTKKRIFFKKKRQDKLDKEFSDI